MSEWSYLANLINSLPMQLYEYDQYAPVFFAIRMAVARLLRSADVAATSNPQAVLFGE